MAKNKRAFWLATGIVAGVLLTHAAKKVKEDIDNMVDEDRDLNTKTKEWFSEKKKHFKDLLEQKQEQINAISIKLKSDIIKEIDEEKRKALVQKATEKIAKLKEEIKEISNQRREEFLYYMRKINATNVAELAAKAHVNLKKFAKENFTSDKKPVTDMDFDYEDVDIEIEEDEE